MNEVRCAMRVAEYAAVRCISVPDLPVRLDEDGDRRGTIPPLVRLSRRLIRDGSVAEWRRHLSVARANLPSPRRKAVTFPLCGAGGASVRQAGSPTARAPSCRADATRSHLASRWWA